MKKWEVDWIKRGRQKQAIFRVIQNPMTPAEILGRSREINSKITFGDVTNIVRMGEKKGIVICLTPERLTGRIYFLTKYGRSLVNDTYGLKIRRERAGIDWGKYADIAAGKTRRHVLLALDHAGIQHKTGLTLAQIRRRVNSKYPTSLSQMQSSVRPLARNGLVTMTGFTKKRSLKQYELTDEGMAMSGYLREISQ